MSYAKKPLLTPLPETIVGCRWVPLTQEQYALVDDKFYKEIVKHNWFYIKGSGNTGYARCNLPRTPGHRPTKRLHVLVWELQENVSVRQLDHINRNGLDCRIENLRPATHSQNGINRIFQKNNTSGYKGVYWHKKAEKWCAAIRVNNKTIYLGLFDVIEEAAKTYDVRALVEFGDRALLNFQIGAF
jgi:hypothetical protein